MGGKADVAAISSKAQLELADILPILETGQMLDFIEVKSGAFGSQPKATKNYIKTDTCEFKTISEVS
ncbi:MAG: hypothetical protein WCC17_04690 [Candidatus Nitrosopolaris sp.]